MIPSEDRIIIEAHTPSELETELERSVGALIEQARAHGDHGITVTRCSPRLYIVELDPRVQYGTIIERCQWQQ